MRTVTSELLSIPGIGPARRRALLTKFGSLQGIREAKLEDIAALPGFSEASAKSCWKFFHLRPQTSRSRLQNEQVDSEVHVVRHDTSWR